MKTHSALLFCSLLISYLLSDTVSSYKFSKSLFNSQKCFTRQYRWETFATSDETVNEAPVEDTLINPENITSKKITKYEKDIAELKVTIENLRQSRKQDEGELETLNKEYGSEIERVKKGNPLNSRSMIYINIFSLVTLEFSRIKERAQEESRELQKQAKVDAVKAILPINDDYLRAKSVYLPLQNENEEAILSYYDGIFTKLGKILEEFGKSKSSCQFNFIT